MAFVQGTGIQSVGAVSLLSKAFASNVTAGSLIAVSVSSYPSTGGTPRTHTCSDTIPNTYSSAIANTGVSGDTAPAVEIFRAPNVSGGATTVRMTPSANAYMSIAQAEASGIKTSDELHQTASADETDASPSTGNMVTTAACFLMAAVTHNGSDTTLTVGTGWTLVFEEEDTSEMPISCEYQIGAAGTYAGTWTLGASRNSCCVGAAFEEAASGATGSGTPSTQAATISGTGNVTASGTGTPSTEVTTTAGSGQIGVQGTGAPSTDAATVTGTGNTTASGSGSLSTETATVAGSGSLGVQGTGAPSTHAATVTGTGDTTAVGTGAPSTQTATTAGTGTFSQDSTGSGAPVTETATVAGTGDTTASGTGAISVEVATVSGSGTFSPPAVEGSGAITTEVATASGDGNTTVIGTGAISTQTTTISGLGDFPVDVVSGGYAPEIGFQPTPPMRGTPFNLVKWIEELPFVPPPPEIDPSPPPPEITVGAGPEIPGSPFYSHMLELQTTNIFPGMGDPGDGGSAGPGGVVSVADYNKILVSPFHLQPRTVPTARLSAGRLVESSLTLQQPGMDLVRFGREVRGIFNSLIRKGQVRFVGISAEDWEWEIALDPTQITNLTLNVLNVLNTEDLTALFIQYLSSILVEGDNITITPGPTTIVLTGGGFIRERIFKTFDDLNDSAVPFNSIPIFTLPARGVLHGVFIKHGVAWEGGATLALSLRVGYNAPDYDNLIDGHDSFSAVSGTNFSWDELFDHDLPKPVDFSNDTVIHLAAQSDGGSGDLSVLTAGEVEIWIDYSVLPTE